MTFAHYLVAIPTEPSDLTKSALFSTRFSSGPSPLLHLLPPHFLLIIITLI
ncbi:hypothetical protein NC651_026076 [Populus alba x Populus x berolinensis]|nr:hypothetical protein NC651_026076 [Populus alba x Populus x berolinensis]